MTNLNSWAKPSATELPKGMSNKKAHAWIAAHPEVDAYAFWIDQSKKLQISSRRWLYVAIIFLSVSLLAQITSFVIKIVTAGQ